MNLKNAFASPNIGFGDHHITIETSRAQKRRIENIGAVRGRDQDDALFRIKTIHFDEQLV